MEPPGKGAEAMSGFFTGLTADWTRLLVGQGLMGAEDGADAGAFAQL
jgi:hypothetical protein